MQDQDSAQTDFATKVQAIVAPSIAPRGFVLQQVRDFDEGGRRGTALFFVNNACKLQIYWSAREREINCMMAPLSARNVHGLYDKSGMWHYLNDFVPKPDIPLEELVRQLRAERANFETQEKWLTWITARIDQFYDSALAGIRGSNSSDGHQN
jgi:hypothetical protein